MTGDTRPNVNYGDRDLALNGEIIRTVVGSTVHGLAIDGQDDRDEMGVYIPPPEYVCGLANPETHVWRTQPEGARSGPGDTDLTIYTLRKFTSLAVSGNPTILVLFFVPDTSVLVRTAEGDRLRKLAPHVVSRQAGRRFLGYLNAQAERMDGLGKQNRVPKRPELMAAHGWDVKYGSHAYRLALQGIELMRTGRLALPMDEPDRSRVLAMRRGEVSFTDARQRIAEAAEELAGLVYGRASPLPERPDMGAVNRYLVEAHRRAWDVRTSLEQE